MKNLFILILLLASILIAQEKSVIYPENFAYGNDTTITSSTFEVYDSLHIAIQITDTVNAKVYFESSILSGIWSSDSIGVISDTVLNESAYSVKPSTGIMYGRVKLVFAATGNDTQANGKVRLYKKEWDRK